MLPRTRKLIRLLIIDDHAITRKALRVFLERLPDLTIVGDAASPEAALAAAVREQPDIILLDLVLGDANGLDLLTPLRTGAPGAHIVVLTGVCDADVHRRAIQLGARGVVLKGDAPKVLVKAIAEVAGGVIWLNSLGVARVLHEMPPTKTTPATTPETQKINALTAREREIIRLLGQGLKNHALADRLGISEATVRDHLTSIFGKLGVRDRLQLAIYAYRHGLASFPPTGA
jgi:two-component system, NarL family, nitrate/nitrite response regulator NarL